MSKLMKLNGNHYIIFRKNPSLLTFLQKKSCCKHVLHLVRIFGVCNERVCFRANMRPCPQVQYNVILSGPVINLWKMEEVVEKLTEKICAIATAVSKIRFPADKLWEFFFQVLVVEGSGEEGTPSLLFSANKYLELFVSLVLALCRGWPSLSASLLSPSRWCLWSEAASFLPLLRLEQFAETEGGIYSPTGIGGWHKLFW